VVEIKPERIEEYKRLHAEVWPEVLDIISRANIRNYSIYLRSLPDGKYYLFSYFEYLGNDLAADMEAMEAEPVIQKWFVICKPCHEPLPDRAEGEWWATMEEVFHHD